MRKRLTAAFFILLAAYVLFQARFLILGPQITVDSPAQDEVVPAGVVVFEGTARNASFITLNGRQIYTDQEGHWREKLIASPGINIMKLTVKDRFGREALKEVRILAQ